MLSHFAVLKTGEGVTQPEVLSLTDAKAHLNITHSHQDALIQSYIDAAIDEAQNYTARSLKIYEVTIKLTSFMDELVLTLTPYLANLAIKYFDESNTEQTLDPENYVLGYHFGEPVLYYNDVSALPSVYDRQDAITITYDAGYGLQEMPTQFVQFCKLLVGTFYEHRTDSVNNLPRLSYSLIHKFKQQWQ
jgi:uncharacterized phiE125 gp8 family phage protein